MRKLLVLSHSRRDYLTRFSLVSSNKLISFVNERWKGNTHLFYHSILIMYKYIMNILSYIYYLRS